MMKLGADFHKRLLDGLYDGVYFTDTDRRITYWNHGAERISGYAAEEVVGRTCADNVLMHVDEHGEQLCLGMCPLAKTMVDGEEREATVYLHHKDGHRLPVLVRTSPIRDDDGEIIGGVEVFSDNSAVSSAARRPEDVQKPEMRDALTRLANRRYAEIALRTRLDELVRYSWPFGLLFADIDRFKAINDRYGREVGDWVLKVVAGTLQNNVRSRDTVARWGGEEFVVIVPNVETKQLARLAERSRLLVERSWFSVGTDKIGVTVSVGAALGRSEDKPEDVVGRADVLMLESKQLGGNRVTVSS